MYDVGEGRLLMVASDRLSAFDVVMDEPIESPNYFATWNGRRVNFCCEDCVGAFIKKPEKWLARL